MIEDNLLNELINQPGRISKLNIEKISEIFQKAKEYFKEESLLIDMSTDNPDEEIMVIGDIHGNLGSLREVINYIELNDPKYVLFLGDIVDRGSKQLECLIIILSLKLLKPRKYFILRGNHETEAMNRSYGFYTEFNQRYQDRSAYNHLLELYNLLPVCAIINEAILCLHGGIPQDYEILNKIKNLKTQDLVEKRSESIEQGIYQIMWNDPKEGLGHFKESFRGPGIKFFGEKAFDEFMDQNDLKYLIRAHECFPEGYKWFFDARLLTIFSSENYRGPHSPNPATFAIVQDAQVKSRILE